MKNYWLFKCEPTSYSIEDLKRDKTTFWNGVRNYQARNFLRDSIKEGDEVLYYHSNAEPSGVVGLAQVVRNGYPDETALDPRSKYFDPKASKDKPIWYMVDIEFVSQFKEMLPLPFLREIPALKKMELLRTGSRLSVQPVTKEEFQTIVKLAQR